MSDFPTPFEQRYTQVLYRYTSALERGDIEIVAAILRDAEQDQHLEQLVLNANMLYQRKNSIAVSRNEVEQGQAMLLNTFTSYESEESQEGTGIYSSEKLPVPVNGHVNTQKGRQQPMQDITSAKLQKQQVTTRRLRLHSISTFIQTLAAVLVVGILLSGFALLFASRHNITTGSGIFGGGNGHATLSHSILVTSTDDGTIYGTRPDTGAVAWHYATGRSLVNGSSTFTVQGQVVYFAARGQMYALRATSGTLLWHKNLDYPKAELTNYFHIVVDQGIVYVSGQTDGFGIPGGIIYALHERDGAILWQYQSYSDPLLAVHNGVVYAKRVLDDQGNMAVQALRGSDGKYLWHYNTEVISVVADDTAVYVYSGHPLNVPGETPPTTKKQNKTLLALNTKGVLLWSKLVVSNGVSPIIMTGNVVILGGIGEDMNIHYLCAYSTSNGSQIWSIQNGALYTNLGATPHAVVNNIIYSSYPTASTSNTVHVESRNVRDGSLRWSSDIVSNLDVYDLVVINRAVYANVGHRIYALDADNGHIHWQLLNSVNTFTSLAVGSW